MLKKSESHSDLIRPWFMRRLLVYAACFITAGTLPGFFRAQASPESPQRTLTFAERVTHQRAIENVYWRHRIWPKENLNHKPALDAVMTQAQVEKKVADYLRNSQVLEDYWQRPITSEQLQAEMDRMAEHTRQPDVLREVFTALGDDPFVIAECLARPVLSERLITSFAHQQQNGRLALSEVGVSSQTRKITLANATYTLPIISDVPNGCVDNTWTATSTINAPPGIYLHTTVWTGSEMIVWGGEFPASNTGGRYNPSTDSWTATSPTNAPSARYLHTAVWTGREMIIWGGLGGGNTGGRYNPGTDSWTATSTVNAPSGRQWHTAVWTGSEMIVWGGFVSIESNTGGRYDPSTDSWTATSTTNAPTARYEHTAVWTGSEMLVWGGKGNDSPLNTGGRYNPGTDSWTATATNDAPSSRYLHTAVWTESEMIVWGGQNNQFFLNTGGRYNPSTNSWTSTSPTNAPTAREFHTAVWTGDEMIIWGGFDAFIVLNTGGRYNPSTDSWTATSTTNAPSARDLHTAVWTFSEMIVWGGEDRSSVLNTGGRYRAQSSEPFTLTAAGRKVQGQNTVRLTWSGATSTNIDVYRNNALVATTANDGSYTDSTGDTGRARYTYKVCEAGTNTCSNDATVTFRR